MRIHSLLPLFILLLIVSHFACEIHTNFPEDSDLVTDVDGNSYITVKIGEQWWMAENLKVTHYRNGDPIPQVINEAKWDTLTTSAYCHYGNDDQNADSYGCLYNWYTVNDNRTIAPEGWHIPTDEEWKQLERYMGMGQSKVNNTDYRGTDEGKRLKSVTGWMTDGGGIDEYGFMALPAGCRDYNDNFYGMGIAAYFWSTSEYNHDFAWCRYLYDFNADVGRNMHDKRNGYSVRCVKDYVSK